ncbi:hypothetical protein DYD21_19755 [Rhodohalobacter sp. SW132]|uniref:hypothetical protein n=1 Tax=Rhodohalobacter sp. SW132 TaxID=2293433 RepID=UPI000E21E732|nr:hypothetical protein [Rhodohalobacter sp. SW132]REL24048.1 hypothetical protein DYD21_19755 [Rhodohalobacter sp. SW132]
MFFSNNSPDYDYLIHERINILNDQGYCGFRITDIKGDSESGQFVVEAKNDNRIILTTKGLTKEEACKKMIDLIDVTVDDY